ncbi:MAG: hypothetical protein Sylvanvirus11_18 [Sylvanvirus sp.]|uniref:Uncharacterized protein n=1 Tax=Sylvanvirus sp. TaxID=2487774 RepID=A0A3G5AI14_9VIRU|nr:MAG: hypothetical protein Sylvanvirus11_18 [Sylvanvirus sp.]
MNRLERRDRQESEWYGLTDSTPLDAVYVDMSRKSGWTIPAGHFYAEKHGLNTSDWFLSKGPKT